MLKHKVYYSTTYSVDGDDDHSERDAQLSDHDHDDQGSNGSHAYTMRISADSYGTSTSYSTGGSVTGEHYSASISGNNYSSSSSIASESANPYDETALSTIRRSVTGSSTGGHVEKKDWNTEYQVLEEQVDSEIKFKKLSQLARDFVRAAQSYAVIIINELCLPLKEKTIEPADLGGVAGGQKYQVQGILFKFTVDLKINDSLWMYGGDRPNDEYACKAASNELKGLMAYYGCGVKGLHYPLMALIDYKGYRLVALSLLPVSPLTIRYGSCNSGLLVHRDIPELNAMMDQASQILNLKAHIAGNTHATSQVVLSPGDLEGHLGNDGKYYVLDFSRTFPPEAIAKNSSNPRAIFYNLLRPEFVRKWDTPLCSDAFSGWQKLDPNKDTHNAEVTEATLHLYEQTIPAFAAKVDSRDGEISEKISTAEQRTVVFRENRARLAQKLALIHLARSPMDKDREPRAKRTIRGDEKLRLLDSFPLVDEMHRMGINVRHLGRVYYLLKSERARSFLMIEMAARAIKSIVREQMRIRMREEKILSEGPFTKTLVDIFNLVIAQSNTPESASFWQYLRHRVATKYAFAFGSSEELAPFSPPTLADSNDSYRVIAYSGESETTTTSDAYTTTGLDARGKGVSVEEAIEFSKQIDVRILFEKVEQLMGITFSQDALRDLHNALDPSDFDFVDSDIGDIHPKIKHMNIVDYAEGMQLSMMALNRRERGRLLKLAASKFENSIRSQPESFHTLYQWGRALFYRAVEIFEKKKYDQLEGNKLLDQATDKFEQALTLNGKFHMAYMDLAHATMLRVSKKEKPSIREAVELYEQAGRYFAKALELKPEDCQYVLDEARDIFSGAVEQIKNKPQLPVAHLLLGVCEICRALSRIRDTDAQILVLWGDVLVLYFSVSPTIEDALYIDVPKEAGSKFQMAVALDPSLSESVIQRAQENFRLAQRGKRNLYRCAAELYRAVDASGLCNDIILLEYANCLSQMAELYKAMDHQKAHKYTLESAVKMQHVLLLNGSCMDAQIRKALTQHGGLLATLARMALYSPLLQERVRVICAGEDGELSSSTERKIYRSHSHPALLSLLPTITPPDPSARPQSPEKTNLPSPTHPDRPKLRFLEFDSPPSPTISGAIPPPPPPPPPPPSQPSPTASILRNRTLPSLTPIEEPLPKLSLRRKSPPHPLPPVLSPVIEEQSSPQDDGFGIKPRLKMTHSMSDDLSPPPTDIPSPIPPPHTTIHSLSDDLSPHTPLRIPPPPPLPTAKTIKMYRKRPPSMYAKRSNPSTPLAQNFAPSRPAVPSLPYNPKALVPEPNNNHTRTPSPRTPGRSLVPDLPPNTPPDASFSLPRTIRKSSEVLQFRNRKRLSKSGVIGSRLPSVVSIRPIPVRPTSIFGSFEPEVEKDGDINLATVNLQECHELGPDSLLSIGNLFGSKIRSVDLSLSPVTDPTIGEFAHLCPNLTSLAIRRSTVGENIHKALSTCWSSVTSLDFEDCIFNFDTEQLEELCRNLPELLSINFTRCKAVTDSVINALFCPVNLPLAPLAPVKIPLQSLSLRSTRVTETALKDIAKYGNITHLDLSGCSKLTDEDLLSLAKSDSMTSLLLESCYSLTDQLVYNVVGNMTKLQRLSLKMCKNFTDGAIVFLSTTLRDLQDVSLSRCFRVTDVGIEALAAGINTGLKALDVTLCTSLTDRSTLALAAHCTNLVKLDISECSAITDYGIAPLLRNVTCLQALHINSCVAVTSKSIMELASPFRKFPIPLQVLKMGACQMPESLIVAFANAIGNLRELNMEKSYVLTNHGTITIATMLPHLTSLNISECVRIDNNGVLAVARNLRNLQLLNISSLRIDGDPVKELGRQAPPLRNLALARCPEVDDSAMAVLAMNLPTLTKLDISGNNNITDKSINILALYAPNLITLEMKECTRISKSAVDRLRQNCPNYRSSAISVNHKSIVDELKAQPPPTDLIAELRQAIPGRGSLRRVRGTVGLNGETSEKYQEPVPPTEMSVMWEKVVAKGLEGNLVHFGRQDSLVKKEKPTTDGEAAGKDEGGDGRKPDAVLKSFEHAVALPPPPPVYQPFENKFEYDILKTPAKRPKDLDPASLEKYLDDNQFQKIFGVSMQEYEHLPSWKKTKKKKEASLF